MSKQPIHQKKIICVTVLVIATFLLGGCTDFITGFFLPPVDQAVQALDDAIDKLDGQSENWQRIVKELGDKLPEDAQKLIRQVEEASQATVALAGIEVRCNADFLGVRLKEQLRRLRHEMLPFPNFTPPEPQPVICQILPREVRLTAKRTLNLPGNQRTVTFFGYNFRTRSIKLKLIDKSGIIAELREDCINTSTDYLLVLNFGTNACGPLIEDQAREWLHIQLEGFFQENQAPNRIAVVYMDPEPCKTIIETVNQKSIDLRPSHTGQGDKDFGWEKVKYKVSFQLQRKANQIDYTLTMNAQEDGWDKSRFEGSKKGTLYEAPEDYTIKSISTSTNLVKIEDTVNLVSTVERPGGAVKEFKIVLKHSGEDANALKVTAEINSFTVTSVQNPEMVTCRP